MNFFKNIIQSWNKMDGTGKLGQILSLPLTIPLTIFCVITGYSSWALVFIGLIYINWKAGYNAEIRT